MEQGGSAERRHCEWSKAGQLSDDEKAAVQLSGSDVREEQYAMRLERQGAVCSGAVAG